MCAYVFRPKRYSRFCTLHFHIKIFLLLNSLIQMRACLIRLLYAYSWAIIIYNQNNVINTMEFVSNSIANVLFYVSLSIFTSISHSNFCTFYYSWVWRQLTVSLYHWNKRFGILYFALFLDIVVFSLKFHSLKTCILRDGMWGFKIKTFNGTQFSIIRFMIRFNYLLFDLGQAIKWS